MRLGPLLVAGFLLPALLACQPADDPMAESAETAGATTPAPLGAPPAGMPTTLDEVRDHAWPLATQWQAEPVLADLAVELSPEAGWLQAQLSYLAPESDRVLAVTVTPEQTTQSRPTLATLGLTPVTAEGIGTLPAFPDDAAEPAALAEAAAAVLEDCGVDGEPERVLYATGAPGAWDGSQWTDDLRWTAAVTTADGGGAFLDPVSSEPLADRPCVG